ncbi:type II toxin-antitoxin system VapC family toxin [Cyanobacterium aponinum UTEX 3222]|uniref:type II toxin-antitoxin system VapC family toxin n=2 Tax=Cyanobacterium aponinum TaxID=379064 RepID=UPI000C12D3C9|nr:type II toxin-antitoxin system VapC family toxin [Cyanobacterium aponinum]PHV62792.1 PIN domain nuclease [Cyanobacterium aponinum IPPAS B-1201]WRL41828.1 type II toxin-antitoxin system VapC family toxin [Cyanobacterium aponinum UTEX 3222]
MKILLDTHAFIWWNLTPEKLSLNGLNLIEDKENIIYLSIASVWEMQIKISINKLHFDNPLSQIITKQRNINNLQILSIELEHIWELKNLPLHHKDPFDRILIAQAMIEKIPILTIDSIFHNYSINTIW